MPLSDLLSQNQGPLSSPDDWNAYIQSYLGLPPQVHQTLDKMRKAQETLMLGSQDPMGGGKKPAKPKGQQAGPSRGGSSGQAPARPQEPMEGLMSNASTGQLAAEGPGMGTGLEQLIQGIPPQLLLQLMVRNLPQAAPINTASGMGGLMRMIMMLLNNRSRLAPRREI